MDQVSRFDIPDETKAMLIVAGVETMFKARPRWFPEDLAILREHYPKGGLAAVRPLLPHKTAGAIYVKAGALRLKAPLPPRSNYTSTKFIDEAIKRYYLAPKKGGLSKLAHQTNRPRTWISARARHLGIVPPRFQEKPWSEPEIELLHKHAPKLPGTIARILAKAGFKRSNGSIKQKLIKLRCDRSDDDTYSACGLAELFGVDEHLVLAWINKGWLKAQRKGSARQYDLYRIHRNSVRRFVSENAGAIDIRRVEKHWFIELLAGHSS